MQPGQQNFTPDLSSPSESTSPQQPIIKPNNNLDSDEVTEQLTPGVTSSGNSGIQQQANNMPLFIGEYNCWYQQDMMSGAKEGLVKLYDGLLVMADALSGSEVYRYELTPDIQLKVSASIVYIRYLNGEKLPIRDPKYAIPFYNPKKSLGIMAFILPVSVKSQCKNFVIDCKKAARVVS